MKKGIKKCMVFICAVFVAMNLAACGSEMGGGEKTEKTVPEVSGNFEVSVLKVGQADAMILQTKNHAVVIDCGESDDGAEVAEYLETSDIKKLDYLFITHFDKDHVGGFPEVIEKVEAEHIIVPDYEGTSDEYYAYAETVESKNLAVTVQKEDFSFVLDDVLFEVSVPQKKSYAKGDNDFSLVISATHGDNDFLFAGDAEAERLTEVMRVFGKRYDFLKIPHHGKHNKSTEKFLGIVKPVYAVATDSKKNPIEDSTLEDLERFGTEVFFTRNGDVYVLSDGKELKISQ